MRDWVGSERRVRIFGVWQEFGDELDFDFEGLDMWVGKMLKGFFESEDRNILCGFREVELAPCPFPVEIEMMWRLEV